MEVVLKKLREERGEISLHLGLILLAGVFLFSAAVTVQHVYAVVDRVVGKTNAAVLAVAASNVAEVFNGVRESDGTARRYTDGTWGALVSTTAVETALRISLDAVPVANGLQAESFEVRDLDTQFVNYDGANLNFTTYLTVEIPLSFGGGLIPPIRQALEVNTTYEPKFDAPPLPDTA